MPDWAVVVVMAAMALIVVLVVRVLIRLGDRR